MTNRPTLRIGLVGAGFLARTRARCWRRVAGIATELSAVAASREENATRFASQWGVGRATADAQAVLEADDVDLVDLCIPNHLHRPFAEAALAAG